MLKNNIMIGKKGIHFFDKDGNKLTLFQSLFKAKNRLYNFYLDFKLLILNIVSFHIPLFSIRKVIFVISGIKIGKNSVIHMGCKFFQPNNIKIGDDTIIGDNAFLDGRAALIIGNHVDIASEVMIYNSEHDINDLNFKAIEEKVIIGDYVFIGPRAIILPGVRIGSGAVVAAGAVVTKDVESGIIVGGIPARRISKRKLHTYNYRLGRARLFQ